MCATLILPLISFDEMQAALLTWTIKQHGVSACAITGGTMVVIAMAAAGRGFGSAKKGQEFPNEKKLYRKMKGKLVGCTTCGGSGKKACIVCKRSGVMQGLLGATVPCYPCQGKGISGRPCVDCKGAGFIQM